MMRTDQVLIVTECGQLYKQIESYLQPIGRLLMQQAATAQQVVALLAETIPQVLLLDLMLSDNQAYDLLRHLRQDQRLKELPVIVLAPADWEAWLLPCTKYQIFDYVTLPLDSRLAMFAVLTRVQNALQLYHKQTALQAAEQAVCDCEDRWQLVVDSTNDGVWDWNLVTNEVYFSPSWKEMLGYQDEEFPNSLQWWQEHLHPEDIDRVLQTMQEHVGGNSDGLAIEYRLRGRDGQYRWVLARGQRMLDGQGIAVRMIGSHVDITKRKQMEEAIRVSEANYRMLLQASPDIIVVTNLCGEVVFISPNIYEMLGYRGEAMLGTLLFSYAAPQDAARMQAEVQHILAGECLGLREYQLVKQDGSILYWEGNGVLVRDDSGFPQSLLFVGRDISARRQAEMRLKQSETRYRSLFNAMMNGFLVCDVLADATAEKRRYRILDSNPAFHELFEIQAAAVIGVDLEQTVRDYLFEGELLEEFFAKLDVVAATGRTIRWEVYASRRQQYFDVVAYLPQPGQVAMAFADITERKMLMAELQRVATTDKLTGLLNRRQFEHSLQQQIRHAEHCHSSFSLILFDVDNFKNVNDTYGHLFGDSVLQGIARTIGKMIRSDDCFARWGGEEFAVLSNCSIVDAKRLAERIRSVIAEISFGERIVVSASFGVASYASGDTAERLMQRVDAAMYRAKNSGKNQVIVAGALSPYIIHHSL